MTLEELKEKLADIEHQRWSHWQEYCNKVLREQVPKLGLEKALERWDRQINTPYAELSEKEKQSDRNQVERYWGLIEEYLDQAGREDVRKDTHNPLVEEVKEEAKKEMKNKLLEVCEAYENASPPNDTGEKLDKYFSTKENFIEYIFQSLTTAVEKAQKSERERITNYLRWKYSINLEQDELQSLTDEE